ncbi:ABC transporter substrate-binding protein [Agrobacterium rhizogenes]|uniref:ABC transporter substrate-binding protein n=1 Tax=Rhizobium rhizogenes TaxID=359 RepID=UPI000DDC579D|nr:ABC transporter substrate-binding protein [Rhizobium rhizogenes]NTF83888.1 ABC transporter substrate-binding protein [Rhizobium rhizogenes]NTH15024.1 ABC transporter substrate-binding protein [Rhizobium rhizogenes]NTH79939.1 ABC transporter substrate-binding protein [Rhizobium rhizogenes]NTH85916.1 ABC transporter substrate-binding protein [Rhizobium rhizogenes]NTI76757.1 ABC transporter substrate-binding protein [Rhizobium rhizogenes]
MSKPVVGGASRRELMKRAAMGIAAVALWPEVMRFGPANAATKTIRIGHIAPQTGPLASFGEPVEFVLAGVEEALKNGIAINGEVYAVEILNRDSQSNPNRAAEVAAELILRDEVSILLAASTFVTVNPVADQAEANGVPCITADCPWQPYVFGRNGNPKIGFEWTYHFFWGLEDATQTYNNLWASIGTNKTIGALLPNDADGNAWGNPDDPGALPQTCARNGFKFIDGGRFTPGIEDYSAQISKFQKEGVEIVGGVLSPPDFALFWQQCAQQNFHPKIVTIAKALLFPSVLESLGNRGNGLSTEVWWSPHHPFKSGLTGQSAKEMNEAYTQKTGRPWTQPIGFKHALFEVAIDVLKRASDTSAEAIIEAVKTTDYTSIVGHIKWDNPDLKNICKTPVVAGQWRKTDKGYDLVICDNTSAPEIPVASKLEPIV